ncbi:hypothetical protein PIB30_059658 [Stylosanthes scabra]|uniref:GDSL esterase/lipase n=1 Tax=Stylosanthes scabra TaxID=79078 RepID=A0ABU6TK29_9FABA|nr:hypothetical protein [Stylosanthes scabra]
MKKQSSPSIIALVTTLLLVLVSNLPVEGARKTKRAVGSNGITKLFVFGDSYVDTGNFVHSPSFKPPYGMTFPGYPSGRFSDGHVLTDLIAEYLGIDSPIPSAARNLTNIQNGINFAHGGTGVFDTNIDGPNLTAQIDNFEQLIQQNLFTKRDLEVAYVLVNAGANDYTTHIKTNGIFDIPTFTSTLVNKLGDDLRRFASLGIGRVAVSLLQPVGCLPLITNIDFHLGCIGLLNRVSKNHNKLLNDVIQELNHERQWGQTFVPLNLYAGFISTIDMMMKKAHNENSSSTNAIENALKACCVTSIGHDCGDVNHYAVCDHPDVYFFWDDVHPSQAGWNAIFSLLKPAMVQLTQQ